MIGNEAHGQTIASVQIPLDAEGEVDTENLVLPKGWSYLGSGAWRHAFLGPDGLVYKVNVSHALYSTGEDQYYVWREFMEENVSIPGIRFAAMDFLFDSNVQVCEYAKGSHPGEEWDLWEMMDSINAVSKSFKGRFLDLHSANVIVEDDGTLCIIDF